MDNDLILQYSSSLEKEGFTYRSRIGHRYHLRCFFRWFFSKHLTLHQIDHELFRDYLRFFRLTRRPSLRCARHILGRFFLYAVREGLMSDNPAEGISCRWLDVPGGFVAYQGALRQILRRPAEILKHQSPLFAPYWEAYLQGLLDRGYAKGSLRRILFANALFHQHLVRKRIRSLNCVMPAHLTDFLRHYQVQFRRRHGCQPGHFHRQHLYRAIFCFLTFAFRQQNRFFQKPQIVADSGALPDALLNQFRDFCRRHKGVKEITLTGWNHYLLRLRTFLDHRHIQGIRCVTLTDIDAFFMDQSARMNPSALALVITAVRVFFRFLYLQGLYPRDLAQQFKSPCHFRADRRPKYLPWAKIQEFLASIDRTRPRGIRAFAALTLLIYHGLRPGEVARLTWSDIDWEESSFWLRERKNGHSARFPLSPTVKEALQKYLAIRPACNIPNLFLTERAPLRALSAIGLGNLTARYLHQCFGNSLHMYGPYLFRHSFAKTMLDRGATLPEVGALLGHKHLDTTLIYTRIHTVELREASDNFADFL